MTKEVEVRGSEAGFLSGGEGNVVEAGKESKESSFKQAFVDPYVVSFDFYKIRTILLYSFFYVQGGVHLCAYVHLHIRG